MPRDEQLVEVIVRPRCRLWRGGAVHLPGARLNVTDDEYMALASRRVVSLASDENVAAIGEAIAKGLPIPGYVVAEDAQDDVTDPAAVARRASAARVKRPAAQGRRPRARAAE